MTHSIAHVSVWHADIRLVGTTFSRSHLSCFQSIGNAKPNGIQSTQYMQLVRIQTILGMDPPESVCMCVGVGVCLCSV